MPQSLSPFVAPLAVALAACGLLVGAACHDDDHHHDHAAAPAPAPSSAVAPGNPVQAEMQLLRAAMHATVEAIADGDVRTIPAALHRVHEAKGATEEALRSGRYRTPKNGDDKARFREMDEAFHAHLERMVAAGRKNDVAAMAEAYGGAIRGCDGCHAQFRR